MSLPDTIFIFVLALIIFGPKRLPEIGRQIGKLVGEFRKASNEFKFQIEEELRQAELADRRKAAPVPTIAPPVSTAAASASPEQDLPLTPAAEESAESLLPAGQHPNPDYLTEAPPPAAPAAEEAATEDRAQPGLTVTVAEGAQPRSARPFAPAADTAGEPEHPAAPVETTHG